MRLNDFNERDQNKIVLLAIKRRDNVVNYKNQIVHIPDMINALFVCTDRQECSNTLDVSYYSDDIIEGNVAQRIQCIECGQPMNRKYIGVNISIIINKYMKKLDDFSEKDNLDFFFGEDD